MTLPKPILAHPMTAQWIAFERPGRVTVLTGRVEFGQGVSAALIRLAAGELGLAEDRVDLVSGATDRVPDEGPTVGSLSVQQGGMSVRLAASAARWECLSRAGKLLQVAPEVLEIEGGAVVKDGLETGLDYWSLTAEAALAGKVEQYAAPLPPTLRPPPETTSRRADVLARLRGERFIQDLVFPDMLHGRMIQPPFGTKGLGTSEDEIGGLAGAGVKIFRDGALVGVTGADEHRVAAAANRLREGLDWDRTPLAEPLSALDMESTEPEAVVTAGSLPEAAPAVSVSLSRPCVAHASIGSCCALARFEGGRLYVWSHSQGVFGLRGALARVLGLEPDAVTVRHVPGAGCYGHNGADDVALDAALLARVNPGRHVRVLWARADEFRAGPLSPAMRSGVRAWLGDGGRIEGMEVSVTSPPHSSRPAGAEAPNLRSGAYMAAPVPLEPPKDPPATSGGGADRNGKPCYDVPALSVLKRSVTGTGYRPSALRGLGAQVNVAAIEAAMDELAETAGTDAFDFRLAHLSDPRARSVIEKVREISGGLDGGGERTRGLGFARYKNASGYCAVVAELEIGDDIRCTKLWAAADVGEVVDRTGAMKQVEGGMLQALSITLHEGVRFEGGEIATERWDDYPILGFDEVPDIEVGIIDRPEEPPLGAGEIAAGPTTAALLNAAARGLGVRPVEMPLTRETLLRLLS